MASRQRNDQFTIYHIEAIRHHDEAATRIARLCGNNLFDLILRVNRGVTYLNGKGRCGGWPARSLQKLLAVAVNSRALN